MLSVWPDPTAAHVAFFREHGWLHVPDAIDPAAIEELRARCRPIVERPERYGLRPGGQAVEDVVQSTLELVWIEWRDAAFHAWTLRFAAALMGTDDLRFWFNQLLFKPPRAGLPTYWHQDEAYLSDREDDLLVSCWMPLHDVDVDGACMHYVDGGHRLGIIEHLARTGGRCGLGPCGVDEDRAVAVPVRAGGVVFHHGKTPHMTHGNRTDRWRQAVIQRFSVGMPPTPRDSA